MQERTRWWSAPVALLLACVACGGEGDDRQTGSLASGVTDVPAPPGVMAPVQPAPQQPQQQTQPDAMLPMAGAPAAPTAPSMSPAFDAGSDPARNAVVAGTICERLATIQCAGEAHCCAAPMRDVASCKQAQLTLCSEELLADLIAAQPSAGFDASAAQAAFTELERLASQCDTGFASFAESLGGLRGMFEGTVEAGGSCMPSSVLDRAAAGAALASCTDAASQACMPSLLRWTCAPRSASGDKCFSDVNCQDGLFCDNPDLEIAGSTCMARKPAGSPCALPNECASLTCSAGTCVEGDVQAVYCL